LTTLSAVNAELRRRRVLLLTFGGEREAMLEAGIALQLAFSANLGAFHKVLRVFAAVGSEGPASR